MRFIVDAQNAVQFVQTADPSRLLPRMQWPAVMGANILEVVPDATRAGLTNVLAEVRARRSATVWTFPSAIHAGEMRVLQAAPVRNHTLWVGLTVVGLPQEVSMPSASVIWLPGLATAFAVVCVI